MRILSKIKTYFAPSVLGWISTCSRKIELFFNAPTKYFLSIIWFISSYDFYHSKKIHTWNTQLYHQSFLGKEEIKKMFRRC